MGLHHRDFFGMYPIDSYMDPMAAFGVHAHTSTSIDYDGPKHWSKSSSTSVNPKVSSIREVDLSVTQYRTPLLYAKIHGECIKSDDEIDEASHQWDVNEEEYQRDVMSQMPDWVLDYVSKLDWLHGAKVKCLGEADEVEGTNFESVSFRIDPHPSKGQSPIVLTFTGVWVNERYVLPPTLRTPQDDCIFLYDEFTTDTISAGVEELGYHFFLSTGIEYSIEGLYGIEWTSEDGQRGDAKAPVSQPGLTAQAEVDRLVHESIKSKLPQAEPFEPVKAKKKHTRGKGKNGVKLFTAMFYIDDFLYVEQLRSKDWTTIWNDFREKISSGSYDPGIDGKSLLWESNIFPFSQDYRNVFVGQFWIDGKEVEVTFVNTKRGKQPGSEKFDGLAAYIDS